MKKIVYILLLSLMAYGLIGCSLKNNIQIEGCSEEFINDMVIIFTNLENDMKNNTITYDTNNPSQEYKRILMRYHGTAQMSSMELQISQIVFDMISYVKLYNEETTREWKLKWAEKYNERKNKLLEYIKIK